MAHLARNGPEVTFVAAFSDKASDTTRGLAIGGTRFSKVDLRGGHDYRGWMEECDQLLL